MALSAAARQRLDEAAEVLVEEWHAFTEDAVSQAEVAAGVADVVSRVVETAEDRPPADDQIASLLTRRIVTLLRRRLLELGDRLDPDDGLRLLRALEQVAVAIEPRWSERF
ncbi:MAG: hypothetical protein ACREK8_06375, partial [Gemmatimonadales bacterium]